MEQELGLVGQVPQLLLCVAMGPCVRHGGALPPSLRAWQVEVQFCLQLTHSKTFGADSTECSASRRNDSHRKVLFGCSWQKESIQRCIKKKKKVTFGNSIFYIKSFLQPGLSPGLSIHYHSLVVSYWYGRVLCVFAILTDRGLPVITSQLSSGPCMHAEGRGNLSVCRTGAYIHLLFIF